MTPMERGQQDYLSGRKLTQNPYPPGKEHRAWAAGWNRTHAMPKRAVVECRHGGTYSSLKLECGHWVSISGFPQQDPPPCFRTTCVQCGIN